MDLKRTDLIFMLKAIEELSMKVFFIYTYQLCCWNTKVVLAHLKYTIKLELLVQKQIQNQSLNIAR